MITEKLIMGVRLNENLLAILVVVLALYLATYDGTHADILREVIYAYLGFLLGKRWNPQERRK